MKVKKLEYEKVVQEILQEFEREDKEAEMEELAFKIARDTAEVHNLTPSCQLMLCSLIGFQQRYAHTFPSVEYLASEVVCSVRTIQRNIKTLSELGLLEVTPQFRRVGGMIRQATNRYKLTDLVVK